MLLNWRRRNSWSQYTAFIWNEAIGEPKMAISYCNLSVIEQGKTGEPHQKLEAAIPIDNADFPVWRTL